MRTAECISSVPVLASRHLPIATPELPAIAAAILANCSAVWVCGFRAQGISASTLRYSTWSMVFGRSRKVRPGRVRSRAARALKTKTRHVGGFDGESENYSGKLGCSPANNAS